MAFIAPIIAAVGTAAAGASAAIGTASTAISIGGAVLGGVGALVQGQASAQAAKYNAAASDIQAKTATDQAASRASESARQTRLKLGAAEAGGLENGFEQGGSMDVLHNAIQDTGQLDKLLSIYDGSVQATGYSNKADLSRSEAGADQVGSYIGAGTKLLTGVSAAYR